MSTNSHGYLDDDAEYAARYSPRMYCPACDWDSVVYWYDEKPICTNCHQGIPENDPLLDELAANEVRFVPAMRRKAKAVWA